jgi:hypothetical protein
MIPFQYVGIAACGLFAVASLTALARGTRPRWPSLIGFVLGVLGAVTFVDPDITTRLARMVGITRGADLLLYLTTLAFVGSWFYFHNKVRVLSNDITSLVRAEALRSARIGDAPWTRESSVEDPADRHA